MTGRIVLEKSFNDVKGELNLQKEKLSDGSILIESTKVKRLLSDKIILILFVPKFPKISINTNPWDF
jgi:hypothetical protein